jgi:hypothetical protein
LAKLHSGRPGPVVLAQSQSQFDGKQILIELLRTNDMVVISLIESLFRQIDLDHLVLDQHMSVLEGSIGILPRRILVDRERRIEARRLLNDAGLGQYLNPADETA